MPRDSTGTRARLVREAERLFATRGVYRVTVKEIIEAAGQRNVSAVAYHFGSREGILREILLRHGTPLDEHRGRVLAAIGPSPGPRELVASLLVPMAALLSSPRGCDYLRIVAQLTDLFPAWRQGEELSPPHLRRILGLLEDHAAQVPPAVRRERVVALIMLLTAALAERARQLDSGVEPALGEGVFLSNLADMLVGALGAPAGPPLERMDRRERTATVS